MKEHVFFAVFAAMSFAVGLGCLVRALYLFKTGRRARRVLSSIQVFTIGIFFSVLLVFIPICYTSNELTDSRAYIRPLLLAVHHTFRIFILDGDFNTVTDALNGQNINLYTVFTSYAAFLYVLAPLMTFSNVLMLFKNVLGEVRYRFRVSKKHYIMSELNVRSIALATSIRKMDAKAVIVFTDVFEHDDEENHELMNAARDINAVCLKRDVTDLNIHRKKGNVEIFLIGEDESENVSQAVRLTTELNRRNEKRKKHNGKYNVKIFVFSTKRSAAYTIDSVEYDNLLTHAVKNDCGDSCFKLRRVDEIQHLIWSIIPKMKLYDIAHHSGEDRLSVLIVGFGKYGIEFFKTILWYFQFEGYKLEITIIDNKGSRDSDNIKKTINREFPDVLKFNCCATEGEAKYDIRTFSGIDVQSSDFDNLILHGDTCLESEPTEDADREVFERIKRTNLAFVALGDDDMNIEMSVRLRMLFDRLNGIDNKKTKAIAWNTEAVNIYSIVFDEQKSGIIQDENCAIGNSCGLKNHRGTPYHIHFMGGLSSQFDYLNIYDSELEESAYKQHISWVDIEQRVHDEWLASGEKEKIAAVKSYSWSFEGEQTPAARQSARAALEKYEYYRLSSMAKELYKRELDSQEILKVIVGCKENEVKTTCQCENCMRRKRSEHMRWNAYTMTLGYVRSGHRADRGMQHDKLCAWGSLSEIDQHKN